MPESEDIMETSSEFLEELGKKFAVLNRQFLMFINTCYDANHNCDFTPALQDYIQYSNKIHSSTIPHKTTINSSLKSPSKLQTNISHAPAAFSNQPFEFPSFPVLSSAHPQAINPTTQSSKLNATVCTIPEQTVTFPLPATKFERPAASIDPTFSFSNKNATNSGNISLNTPSIIAAAHINPPIDTKINIPPFSFSSQETKSSFPFSSSQFNFIPNQFSFPTFEQKPSITATSYPLSFPPLPPTSNEPLKNIFNIPISQSDSSKETKNIFTIPANSSPNHTFNPAFNFNSTPNPTSNISFMLPKMGVSVDNKDGGSDEEGVPEASDMGCEPKAICSIRSKLFYLNDGKYCNLGVGIFNVIPIDNDPLHLHLVFRIESCRVGSILMNVKIDKKPHNIQVQKDTNLIITTVPNPPIHQLVEDPNISSNFTTVSYLIKTKSVSEMNTILTCFN